MFRARVIDSAIAPRLIAWHANSIGRSWFMANGKRSVNLASVSLKTIRAFPIPVPPRDLQAPPLSIRSWGTSNTANGC